jgi:hypothetical protein
MSEKKPEPILYTAPSRKPCPVCGKASYSRNGVHPQCAVQQADRPRQLLLAEAKRQARLLVATAPQ